MAHNLSGSTTGALKHLYQFGGVGFVGSGLFLLLRTVLDVMAGPPPSNGADILAWSAAHRLPLAFQSEILFGAAVLLVPAVSALYASLAEVDRAKAATGSGILALVIPVLALSLVVHGRLIYPIYGLRADSPEVAAFAVAVFYGGLHAAFLLLAVATVFLSLAMWRSAYGRATAWLGFVSAAFDLLDGYPDLIGPRLTLLSQAVATAWFVVVGVRLFRMRPDGTSALPSRPTSREPPPPRS